MSDTQTASAPVDPQDLLGRVFVNDWGWEQTNIDFWQVVGVTPSGKSVKLRRIGYTVVPGSEGFMCEARVPLVDAFVNDEVVTRRLFNTGAAGTPPQWHVNMSYGWTSLHEEGETHRASWYG